MQRVDEKIKRYVTLLLGRLSVKGEKLPSDQVEPIILVEGGTDLEFYKKYVEEKNLYNVSTLGRGVEHIRRTADYCRSREPIDEIQPSTSSHNQSNRSSEKIYSKDAIFQILAGTLNEASRKYYQLQTEIERFDIYGIIDKDFNDQDYPNLTKLFITDTYDLETLILSTDENAVYCIEGVHLTKEEFQKALFLAYQLGKIKSEFLTTLTYEQIKRLGDNYNYFSEFDELVCGNEDLRIDLDKVIKYINKRGGNVEPKIINGLYSATNKLKKFFDQQKFIWKHTFEQFCVLERKDLWESTNGHDIVSALRYVNREVCSLLKYSYPGERLFEKKLIKAYDRKNFRSTRLYETMKDHGLLKEEIYEGL